VGVFRSRFVPAPGWPTPPPGFHPPAGWRPDPMWVTPPGWKWRRVNRWGATLLGVLIAIGVVAFIAGLVAFIYSNTTGFKDQVKNNTDTSIKLLHCGSGGAREIAPHATITFHATSGPCAAYNSSGSTPTYLGCINSFGEGGYVEIPRDLDRDRTAANCD
jgi:hypothetical protein